MTDTSPYLLKPGIHSYNSHRRLIGASSSETSFLARFRVTLLLIGIACLGYYAYTLADQKIYQAYENRVFEQQISRHSTEANSSPEPIPTGGAVIGRVSIDRLHLASIVRQGVDAKTLSESVGHVPSTALPGQPGNFAIAAHRDTLFRALKDIQAGDVVTFQSQTKTFNYQVVATKIVKPTDVTVLRPDGGGLIPAQDKNPDKILTMITCYPFYYVGSAPKRFIVEAKLVDNIASNEAAPHL